MVIVDTNVAMVASKLAAQSDAQCVHACIKRLDAITKIGGLIIDDLGLILREYTKKLGHSGQPGVGHAFVRWVHDNQATPSMVLKVPIEPLADQGRRRFREFPTHQDLSTFDMSDQKFVAVAIASNATPTILNAVDSDWWHHRAALAKAGIVVEFLCPQHAPPGWTTLESIVRTSSPAASRPRFPSAGARGRGGSRR